VAKKHTKKKKSAKGKPALHSETKKSILAITCFALAVLSLLSFLNLAGQFGNYFFQVSQLLFGRGFFFISVIFILIGLAVLAPQLKMASKRPPVYQAVFIGALLFLLSVLGIFYVLLNQATPARAGGYLGLILGYPLFKFFGLWASLIVLLALLVISVLVTFNLPLKIPFRPTKEERNEADLSGTERVSPPAEEKPAEGGFWHRLKEKVVDKEERGREELASQEQVVGQAIGQSSSAAVTASSGSTKGSGRSKTSQFDKLATSFKLPSLDFLEKDKGQPTSGDIKANINIIKRTLENFGIEVEMAEVNVGPTVTQYTLRPAQGVKLSRITALQNDLALALAAHPLRIEAPIPGRSLVGIEIPNRSVVLVRLRSLLERPTFGEAPSLLTFSLGRDVAGNPMFADLARMPHLLVAGATGTGKTIALNNLIISLLYRASPQLLKFILIDPKRVELVSYDGIPHLLTPPITQADKAINALHWTVGEMERRFETLQEAGQRDVDTYNKGLSGDNGQSERLPYIVVVIDELADLMASHGREVEGAIVRLAQMARAVGIHLVVSTQRPSVEVITGLIKANITSRMAFQVASQVDSRTVLDMSGAEKLLGNGDMLFLAGNSAKPRRVQGAFISDKEVKKVVDYLKEASSPDYNDELAVGRGAAVGRDSGAGFSDDGTNDELYEEARQLIIQAKKASASLLQRRLRIGYARAARLLDILEEKGVVGPADGAKPREVYIDEGEDREL